MSGVSSPWGYSPQITAGLNNSLENGNSHLTGQLSLTSTPITFGANGDYISPLTIQNKSYYTAFGKRKKAKSNFNSEINYLKKLKEY
jgi:hypothetical protein